MSATALKVGSSSSDPPEKDANPVSRKNVAAISARITQKSTDYYSDIIPSPETPKSPETPNQISSVLDFPTIAVDGTSRPIVEAVVKALEDPKASEPEEEIVEEDLPHEEDGVDDIPEARPDSPVHEAQLVRHSQQPPKEQLGPILKAIENVFPDDFSDISPPSALSVHVTPPATSSTPTHGIPSPIAMVTAARSEEIIASLPDVSPASLDALVDIILDDILLDSIQLIRRAQSEETDKEEETTKTLSLSSMLPEAENRLQSLKETKYMSAPRLIYAANDQSAQERLLVDSLNEAINLVFSDGAVGRGHRIFSQLGVKQTIPAKELASKSLAFLSKWLGYKQQHGENLDGMLTEDVKREERTWLDMDVDESAMGEYLVASMWDDMLMDTIQFLDSHDIHRKMMVLRQDR